MKMWYLVVAVVLGLLDVATSQSSTPVGGFSGTHTNIPRWCGKPYESGSPNYPPGGMIRPPVPSPTPMLLVSIQPRHSIYDSSESNGQLIVDATLSYTHGEPIKNSVLAGSHESDSYETLEFDIRLEDSDQLLMSNTVNIGSVGILFEFDFGELEPRLTPYHVTLSGVISNETEAQSYKASTELYYLPAKNSGSTVKIDNLYGGMLVANNVTSYAFEELLPFGFYTSCSDYLNYSLANVSAYKGLGFNAINPVCAFTDGDLGYLFDWMDEINLWYQYDMRGSYLNLTSVAEQVPLIKDRSAFLSWYTADEPDGWQYALNSTKLAYNLLKEQDPYHPTGLVLNCDNYHFKEYSAGADYLMEDAYPIGINPTYSKVWNTTCNETYGDCGCDNCIGELQDVSNRFDSYFEYQQWIGKPEKPLWSVLQAFSDDGYWVRDPTTMESYAMMLLSFNHRAKAIMSWTFPTTQALSKAHAAFASVASIAPVSTFLLGANPAPIKVESHDSLDISYWIHENQVMVGFVYLDKEASSSGVSFVLPVSISNIADQPWNSLPWTLSCVSNTSTLMNLPNLDGLATNFVILDTKY